MFYPRLWNDTNFLQFSSIVSKWTFKITEPCYAYSLLYLTHFLSPYHVFFNSLSCSDLNSVGATTTKFSQLLIPFKLMAQSPYCLSNLSFFWLIVFSIKNNMFSNIRGCQLLMEIKHKVNEGIAIVSWWMVLNGSLLTQPSNPEKAAILLECFIIWYDTRWFFN